MAAGGLASRVLDTKLVKGPTSWDGDKKRWKRWSAKLRGYLSGVSLEMVTMMDIAAAYQGDIALRTITDEKHREMCGALYAILNGLLEGEAYDVLMNTESGNGAEVWRKLVKEHEPKTVGHARSRLIAILEPKDLQGSFASKVDKWERRLNEYAGSGQTPIPEDIRMGVLQHYLAPEEIKRHLILNAANITSYSEMKREIENWVTSSAADGPAAMEIDALYHPGGNWPGKGKGDKKGKGKDGKGKGKDGKGKGKDGKGKDGKKGKGKGGYAATTPWWQNWGRGSGGGGAAGGAGSTWFDGNCSGCQKYGHKQANCWYNKKTGGDKDANTSKADGGKNDGAAAGATKQRKNNWSPLYVGATRGLRVKIIVSI